MSCYQARGNSRDGVQSERDLELVKFSIAEEVVGAMTRTGCEKVSAAVVQVAQDRKLSERTVLGLLAECLNKSLARASAWVKSADTGRPHHSRGIAANKVTY